MKPMFIAAASALPGALQRILAADHTYPIEIRVAKPVRKLSDAKRAKIHLVLRACAHHFGYGETAMKTLAKRGELPGVDWPQGTEEGGLGSVTLPVDTMEIPDRDAETLLIQLEQFAAESGVPLDLHDTMEGL